MLNCEQVRVRTATGDRMRDREVADHLVACESCREDVRRLGELFGMISATAEAMPSNGVDRWIRARLSDRAAPAAPAVLRPAMALSLAAAGLLAFLATFSTVLAQAGAAEQGPLVAVFVVWIYMAISATAALPILLNRRLRGIAATR